MIERVKFFAGMALLSLCLPEPPAPMNRCCARLKPSIFCKTRRVGLHDFFNRDTNQLRRKRMPCDAHGLLLPVIHFTLQRSWIINVLTI